VFPVIISCDGVDRWRWRRAFDLSARWGTTFFSFFLFFFVEEGSLRVSRLLMGFVLLERDGRPWENQYCIARYYDAMMIIIAFFFNRVKRTMLVFQE
jgi:hypothetical protein